MLLLLLAGVIAQTDGGMEEFAANVRSPTLRSQAACSALAVFETSVFDTSVDDPCSVNHVIETTGPGGRPAFMVFFAHKWNGEGLGKPVGHFEVFDERGSQIKWLNSANVLEPTDRLIESGGKAPAVVVQQIISSATCGDSTREAAALVIQTVHVVSLAAPQRPLLSLIVGPPTRETVVVRTYEPKCESLCAGDVCAGCLRGEETAWVFSWSWSVDCSATGCSLSLKPPDQPAVVRTVAPEFRWKWPARKVDGPRGSAAGGFLRYSTADEDRAIDAFTAGHGFPTVCPAQRDKGCLDP